MTQCDVSSTSRLANNDDNRYVETIYTPPYGEKTAYTKPLTESSEWVNADEVDKYVTYDMQPNKVITIHFIEMTTGKRHTVQAEPGQMLIDVAEKHGIHIPAHCGGNPGMVKDNGNGSTCSSCHVILAANYVHTALPPDYKELHTLRSVVNNTRGEQSRMACQLELQDAMDGILIAIPREEPLQISDIALD